MKPSVEDASKRRRIHKRGMKRAKLGVEREGRHGVMRGYRLRSERAKQRPTGTDYSIIGLTRPTSHVVRFFTPWSTGSSSARTQTQAGKRDIHEKWRDKSKSFWHPAATGLHLDNTSCKTPSTCTEFHRIRFHHPTIPSTSGGLYHRCGRRTTPTRGGLYGSYSRARYPCNGEGQS